MYGKKAEIVFFFQKPHFVNEKLVVSYLRGVNANFFGLTLVRPWFLKSLIRGNKFISYDV